MLEVGSLEFEWSPELPDGRRCLHSTELVELRWSMDARGAWRQGVVS